MIRPQSTWVSEDALLFRWECDPKSQVSLAPQIAFQALRRHLGTKTSPIIDLIPGACTLLVCFKPKTQEAKLRELEEKLISQLKRLKLKKPPTQASLQIQMRYDGEDLEWVASHLGLRPADFIEWHSSTLFQVAFIGFAPGFPYLVPLKGHFEIPRLPEPRVRVPSGSVAMAGGFCGIYPHSTSGGWRLIGSTDLKLFDLKRKKPSLLAPGDTVRFCAT